MSKQQMNIKESMDELHELISWFEGDDFDIEQALGRYKDLQEKAQMIEKNLCTVKNEITILKQSFDA